MVLFLLVVFLGVQVDGSAVGAAGAPAGGASPGGDGRLTVHLEVRPGAQGKRLARISLRNTSESPLRLWRDTCSWGHEAFELLVTDQKGKATTYPRKRVAWRKNVPQSFVLEGGSAWVLDVGLNSEEWAALEAPPPSGSTVQVVYHVESDEFTSKQGVWTGRVASNRVRLD